MQSTQTRAKIIHGMGLINLWSENHMAIILTDIAIAVWLKNIENDHFYITKLTETSKIKLFILWWCDICWYLYYINVFSYICKKNKIGRPGHRCTTTVLHYKAVLSGIIPLSEHCSFNDLNIALCHIAISIKFQLTVKPFLREWFVNPCLQL